MKKTSKPKENPLLLIQTQSNPLTYYNPTLKPDETQ